MNAADEQPHKRRVITAAPDLDKKFALITKRYREVDEAIRQKHGKPFFDTTHGIWGASHLLDVFELCVKIRLDERKGLVDLGSGDGRVVLVAALFGPSKGIEADEQLHAQATEIRNQLLREIPELERCTLTRNDYTQEIFEGHDTLFTFCDHPWDAEFEKRLMSSWSGVLLSYNKIFLPSLLPKGKTYWIQQLPIISYTINVEEKDLFSESHAHEE